jgi:hypothetical protein
MIVVRPGQPFASLKKTRAWQVNKSKFKTGANLSPFQQSQKQNVIMLFQPIGVRLGN